MSESTTIAAIPSPTGQAAKALVAMIQRPSETEPDPVVLTAIGQLPDADLAAVLHVWYVSGSPWLQLGTWDLWPTTGGTALVDALRAGRKKLPIGTGAYDDPISLRFPKKRLAISIDSNPDDTAPRKFSSLQGFTDTMVIDGLERLDDNNEAWPLPALLVEFFANNGLGEGAEQALKIHVARVAATSGEPAQEATAWLAKHGSPKVAEPEPTFDKSNLSMTFVVCADVESPEPPSDIAAALKATGHLYYHRASSGRWFSMTKKGLRFFNDEGKRKVVNVFSIPRKRGAALVLVDDGKTALVGGTDTLIRVALASGKKEIIFRLQGERGISAQGVSATPDGQAIVVAPDNEITQLDIYDLAGNKLREIPVRCRSVRAVKPLWDDLMLVYGDTALVIDVAKGVVVGFREEGVSAYQANTLRIDDDRLTFSTYSECVELRRSPVA